MKIKVNEKVSVNVDVKDDMTVEEFEEVSELVRVLHRKKQSMTLIEETLKDNPSIKTMRKPRGYWTKPKMKKFLKQYDKLSTQEMMNEYNMKKKTVYQMARKFKQALMTQITPKRKSKWNSTSKKAFIRDFEKMSKSELANKYNVKTSSVYSMRAQFIKQVK